jgi:lipopolysaccharide cholinephosphotransferase
VRRIFRFNKQLVYPLLRLLCKLLPDKTITSGMGIPFHNPRYAKDIFPLTTHQFEDKEFPVPYNADALLRRLYGDYMQLPDLSKLNLHVSKLEFYDD